MQVAYLIFGITCSGVRGSIGLTCRRLGRRPLGERVPLVFDRQSSKERLGRPASQEIKAENRNLSTLPSTMLNDNDGCNYLSLNDSSSQLVQ